jgi:hypothetical protein
LIQVIDPNFFDEVETPISTHKQLSLVFGIWQAFATFSVGNRKPDEDCNNIVKGKVLYCQRQ